MLAEIIYVAQWFFLGYFIVITSIYSLLNVVAMVGLRSYMQWHRSDYFRQTYTGIERPVSVLVPAYNEEATIVSSVQSLLQLTYPEYEILVVNDGSRDGTLAVLIQEFDLKPCLSPVWARIHTQPVRAVYQSATYPNLRVMDKENGGKADSLNAGINFSRYPLFCCVDADSILQRDSLQYVVRPFLEDPTTVAAGGTVRIANGCEVSGGFLVKTGLPRTLLPVFQIVEYLRAFLFGRLGWSGLNALLIISGAFGLFDKESVVRVGGYRTDTVGEDMELVVRLHRLLREAGEPYRIVFVAYPVCWTEAPEDLKTFKTQRVRWQIGLSESLVRNMSLLFDRKSGMVGWFAFPFMLVFEWLGPLIEVAGYVFMTVAFSFGLISAQALVAFLLVAIGFGMLLSVTALLLEEISFHTYVRFRDLLILVIVAFLENFGYRQLVTVWRLQGLLQFAFGLKARWGVMKRTARWQDNK